MLIFPYIKNLMAGTIKKFFNQVILSLESPRVYISFSVLLCIYTFVGLYFLSNYERANDDWEHLAAIKSFAIDPFHPSHPYSFDTRYSHLFTPYHLFWGLVSRISNISPFYLSPLVGVINVLTFVFTVYFFSKKFLGDKKHSSWVLLTLLFLWILAPGYSGYYQFSHIMKTSIYPYRFAFSCSLIIFSIFPFNKSFTYNLFIIPLLALIFLIHPLTGIFLSVVLSVKIWVTTGNNYKVKIILLSFSVIAILISFMWPYFRVLDAVISAGSNTTNSFSGNYKEFYQGQFLYCILPTIPGLYFLSKKELFDSKVSIIVASLLIFLLVYILNFLLFKSSVLGRVVVYIAFTLQILTVIGVTSNKMNSNKSTFKSIYLLTLIILTIPQVLMAFKSFSFLKDFQNSKTLGYYSNFSHVARLEPIYSKLQSGKILVAPADESWILPSLSGVKVLAIKHFDPFMDPKKFNERNKAIENIFNPKYEPKLLNVLKEKIDYVLIRREDTIPQMDGESQIIFSDTSYTLFKIVQ